MSVRVVNCIYLSRIKQFKLALSIEMTSENRDCRRVDVNRRNNLHQINLVLKFVMHIAMLPIERRFSAKTAIIIN